MGKRFFVLVFIGLAVLVGSAAQPDKVDLLNPPQVKLLPDEIPNFLQDISVTISVENKDGEHNYGSGIIKTRDGVHYILTCAHVISGVNQDNGVSDVQVLKDVCDDGRIIGTLSLDAEILAYSEKEDLAILRVRKNNAFDKSVIFPKNVKALPVGTSLYHVGSFRGAKGSGSFTTGTVSKNGRVLSNTVFDQSSCTVLPGSSGGGLFLKSGECIGMAARASGETYNLYIPIRRMVAWANKIGAGFIFDDDVPVPHIGSLGQLPVEVYVKNLKFDVEFPFLIKIEK